MKHLVLVLACACALFGGDVTGRWTGKLTVKSPEGEERQHSAVMVFKQQGTALTGTAGPEEDQKPISKGKVDGDAVQFELERDGGVMRFSLKQQGDELSGEVTRERDGETTRATVAMKREK